MKIRQFATTLIAGAAMLNMAGTASAISSDVNIYGASAQYNFYKAKASDFLTNSEHCTVTGTAETVDKKNYIVRATCSGQTVYFRSSSKASYDGPLAIQGNTTNPNRTTACGNAHQRKMMDESLAVWGGGNTTPNSATKCVTVTGGASDVQVTSFSQESHGLLFGPKTGDPANIWTDRNFKGTGSVTSDGLTNCRPLVVPFGFFVNKGVTDNGVSITDLTTAQARLIFSGQIGDWADLGFDSKPMYTCWRHAGSGTHATIDLAVMRPATLQITQDTGNGYDFWFNDGSGDEMTCMNGNTGAVGYADADATPSANVKAVTYNGVAPTKANITAGLYDFYSVQNLYTSTPTSADMQNLCSYMKDPLHNTNAWYANACEMKYIRADDAGYNMINTEFGICQ